MLSAVTIFKHWMGIDQFKKTSWNRKTFSIPAVFDEVFAKFIRFLDIYRFYMYFFFFDKSYFEFSKIFLQVPKFT